MNRALAEAVVALVGNASGETAARLRAFSPRQWRQNHHWLITSGLALHLLEALRQSDAESVLPVQYHRRLNALYDASGVRTDDLRRDLLDLNRRFQAIGVPYVNWKGFALEPDFCPDIRLRNQTDYDFIIRPEDRDLFHRAVVDAGYVLFRTLDEELSYDLLPGQHYSLEDVYRPKPHRRIELHLGADSAPARGAAMDFASPLQRRQIRTSQGVPFPVLAPEDAFVAHAAHAGKHALCGWVRLAWLLELETFARRHADDVAFWQCVERRLDASSLISAALALALAGCMWPRPLPGVLSRVAEILPRNLVRWLDQNGRSFALTDFPGTKFHLFLHRELLDGSTFRDFERSSLYPVKIPKVSDAIAKAAIAKAPVAQRIHAAGTRARFVLRRLRFHLVENVRYLLMKHRWKRTVALTASDRL